MEFCILERWVSIAVQEILVLAATIGIGHLAKKIEVDSRVF